jgi:hypothetical protein
MSYTSKWNRIHVLLQNSSPQEQNIHILLQNSSPQEQNKTQRGNPTFCPLAGEREVARARGGNLVWPYIFDSMVLTFQKCSP